MLVVARWVLAAVVTTTLLAGPAQADDRDTATVGKITILNRKAVDAYQHLEFDTALRLLNEALEASERAGLMLHPIRARTYMTLGIVTLGGFRQRDQAVKYFRKALQIQPEVRLSPGLANPEIQAAFDEAVATLASGTSDEMTPEKALVHEPIRSAPAGQPLTVTVTPDKDLGAAAIVLRYRPGNVAAFTDLSMQKNTSGAFEGTIPASATSGEQVVYFIEARRQDGSSIIRRGSAADPIVVGLIAPGLVDGPTAAPTAPTTPAAAGSFYFGLLAGTGFGWATGTGETTLNDVKSAGIAMAQAGHLAPEIGYYVTPRLRLGVQGRLQLVTGATPYVPSDLGMKECGGDGVCSPAKGAVAALLKATWLLVEPTSDFQPYVALSAGGGYIRHIAETKSPMACGSGTMPTGVCKDTIPGGPVLFGPTIGFQYKLGDSVGLVAELQALVGMTKFTANADVNVGLAFRL